jgi:hypothetical protein
MKRPKFKKGDLVAFERHINLSTVKYEGAAGIIFRRLKSRVGKHRECCIQSNSSHDYIVFILEKEIKVCENLLKRL